jgi:hypothetical protein
MGTRSTVVSHTSPDVPPEPNFDTTTIAIPERRRRDAGVFQLLRIGGELILLLVSGCVLAAWDVLRSPFKSNTEDLGC